MRSRGNFCLRGILAVIGGALVGIFVTWGIKPVNSLVVAAVIFLAWDMATRKK